MLNKPIRIGDLKKIGLKVEEINEENCHPFVVENECGSGLAISKYIKEKEDDTVDDFIIEEFEGRCSRGGGIYILEICDKLGCKFITDEDIDMLCYTNQDTLTEDMYDNRTNEFRDFFSEKSND